MSELFAQHRIEIVAVLLIGAGLVAVGFRDLMRFSPRRIWAISGACFQECIRRRVLWITPLGIIGVVVLCQIQPPPDPQDAVRQTIKYCLFACGMMVTIVTIILACTNLPREIETRVIYTIVTKPTTRLEIIVGKVVGFARVSGSILLLMGLFTFAYAEFQSHRLLAAAGADLETLPLNDPSRTTLEHYRSSGLLQAKSYVHARGDVQVFARLPKAGDETRWFFGDTEQDALIPFDLPPDALVPEGQPETPKDGLIIYPELQFETYGTGKRVGDPGVTGPVEDQRKPSPMTGDHLAPMPFPLELPGPLRPYASVMLLDHDRYSLINPDHIKGSMFSLPRPDWESCPYVPPQELDRLRPMEGPTRIYVRFEGTARDTEYGVDDHSATLFIPRLPPDRRKLEPAIDPQTGQRMRPIIRGRISLFGQQLRGGDPAGHTPLGIYSFHDAHSDVAVDGEVPFELLMGVERASRESRTDADDLTILSIQVSNPETGTLSEPHQVVIESNRPAYFSLPQSAVASGNFDLVIRCLTNGHYVGLRPGSVIMVAAEQSFTFNLLKSLLILWLMSVLVIIVAVFCSTFVSWPIATVATVVILLGHWGVLELGDYTHPGIGRQVVKDLDRNASVETTTMVSTVVDNMEQWLNGLSRVLPDISQYAASEAIQNNMVVPASVVGASLRVTFAFGLPLMALAYIVLKFKEVAP